MSVYQPFYYPYYSARADLPRSYLELNQKLHHIRQQNIRNSLEAQKYLRNTHYINRPQLHQINRNMIIQQSFQRELQDKVILDELQRINYLKRNQQIQRQSQYLNHINRMRYQKQLIDQINRDKASYSYNQSNYMSDDQLVRVYQSGIKKQQIQRQLANKSYVAPINVNNEYIQHAKIQDKTIKKNTKANINQNNTKVQNNLEKEIKVDQKQSNNKRSFFQDLRQSKNYRSSPIKQNKNKTIDIVRKSIQPFNVKNTVYTKKRANSKKPIKIINKSLNKTFKKQQKTVINPNIDVSYSCPQNIKSQAMIKINNRIKVSRIVYKDSKIRTAQHQMNHLINTYDVQVKGRRQIKNKINNHPDVLKNHLLVAQSR